MPYNHYFMAQSEGDGLILTPEILYTGIMSDTPNWYNERHKHAFCEILYVGGGSGSAVVDGQEYALKSGDLMIWNPGVEHAEQSSTEDPLVLMFLAIKGFSLAGQPPCHLLPPEASPVLSCGEYSYRLSSYFQELIQESSSQVPFYRQITRSLVSAILVLILRLICITPSNERTLSGECRRIKEYLDENYTAPITLGKLSETVYISKHYLSHMFKEQTGVSPIKYLTMKRISTACELLRTTNIAVSEISKRVGYENPLYFSQVFKKINGMSPIEYRESKD